MKIYSHSSIGYEGELIEIEVDIRKGIPGIDIVGLAGSEIKESRERVRAAIKNSQLTFPKDRILINLAPAGIKKIGTSLDLPIAIEIMKKSLEGENNLNILALGELQLDGVIRSVRSVLPAIALARENKIKCCIVPYDNLEEANLIDGIHIWGVKNLIESIEIIKKLNSNIFPRSNSFKKIDDVNEIDEIFEYDFKNIKGQARTKRAIEIAVAGGHNIMLFGPPGGGKTLSIKGIPSILPPLTSEELIETNRIWSVSGKLVDKNIMRNRPFRSPHHSASKEGLIGGGPNALPGEVSLAHNGILFLDETLEFQKAILQSLREPIEDKSISIVRASSRSFKYPSNFQLVLAMNACPCGNMGKQDTECFCSFQEISNYWKRLGAAMLDRIDIRVPVKPVTSEKLFNSENETSKEIKARIIEARQIQTERYKHLEGIYKNSDLKPEHIEIYTELDSILKNELIAVLEKLNISSRATHSILKVARTISDLKGEKDISISRTSLFEAVEHRKHGDSLLQD